MEEMDMENPRVDGEGGKLKRVSGENSSTVAMRNDSEQVAERETDSDDSNDTDDDDADEAEVRMLEASLIENPYDYACHVTIISKLQRMGELTRLRLARENMSAKYPLSPELWLSWIRDETKLSTSREEKAKVADLCERAIDDYLSVDVWLEYLQFSIGNMGSEQDAVQRVRQLFERALTDVGLHVIKGAIIWEAFREFEMVLFALIDPEKSAERKEQLDRVGNLFRRQLACPLLDMEKTLEEYECWRAGDGAIATIDDDIVRGGYERALSKLNLRLPFEEKLVSAQGEHESLDAYRGYLLYETQHGDPGRTTVLYERAVAELSVEASLWLDYLDYLEKNIKLESVLERAYRRASRNVPWCASVWQKWIRGCERRGEPVARVQSLFEDGLSAGFSSAEEYRNLWLTYLEYLRRRVVDAGRADTGDRDSSLEILRETFNRACEHLAKAFGLDGDRNCLILQYWARTEAIHARDMERARSLWADILSQGHSSAASYWFEYISLERCYGDTKHLRKLYQKALASVKDWPEGIGNSWIDFERDEGTLEQMEFCEMKTKERYERVAEERQKQQQAHQDSASGGASPAVASSSGAATPSAGPKRATKRKAEKEEGGNAGAKWKNLPSFQRKSAKYGKDDRPRASVAADQTKSNLKNIENISQEEMDESLTVFLSNLDYAATEEEVRDALAPAGTITLLRMVKDYKGRSKGYCYAQFAGTGDVERALQLDRTSVRGRPMFVSRCAPDKAARDSAFKYSSTLEKKKLFVKGLPVTTTKEQLEEMFKRHGSLKEVRLVTYRNGHSKGLAYVDFVDEASAAKALISTDGIEIEGKAISVAISQPPARKGIPHPAEFVKSLGSGALAAGGSKSTTFGLPKTLLSMVPRNVRSSLTNGTRNNNDPTSNNGASPAMTNQQFRDVFLNKK